MVYHARETQFIGFINAMSCITLLIGLYRPFSLLSTRLSLSHTRTLRVNLHNQVHEASLIIWPPGRLPATSAIPLLGSY